MLDVWALLQPSSLLVVFLLFTFLSVLVGRRGAALSFCLLAVLLALGPVFVNLPGRLAWELERRTTQQDLPDEVDGILVLGGALAWDVSRERSQLSLNEAGERVLAAAALARRYPGANLAFTGLYREDIAEDFLATPSDRSLIFGEEFAGRSMTFIGESRSTYEDALLALERLSPQSGETWLLVTSAMHMPRAARTFRNLGWGVTPYPVDYRTSGEPAWLEFDPRPGQRLAQLDQVVREWGAIFVYERAGRISWP